MRIRRVTAMLKMLTLLVLTAGIGLSQSGGKLTGRVTNDRGEALQEAEVRLRSSAGVQQRTRSDERGMYSFDNVAPGTYNVEIETNGKIQSSPGVIEIGSTAMTMAQLVFEGPQTTPAPPTGPVTIEATSSPIQSSSAEVSRAYETRAVRSLPLIDRQNQELISLMPGVTPPVLLEDRVTDPQRTRIFNINGLPDVANTYFQDGAYANENYSGRATRIVSNEAVQQLNVKTSNYNAENGLAGGGWINTVTRPGTNGLHGSLFGLHTNRYLTRRSPVNFSTNQPGFNVNQFGGSVGGPVIKDKTFWFGAYERYNRRGSVLQIDTVPGMGIRGGDFSGVSGFTAYDPNSGTATGQNRVPLPGNRIPMFQMNPVSARILRELPQANLPGNANNLAGDALLLEDQQRIDGKIDHRFSEKSTGFFRYGLTHGNVERGSQLGALGNGATAGLRNHNAVASLTQSISTTLAAEFRVGFSRYRNRISPIVLGGNTMEQDLSNLGFNQGLPQISISGYGDYGYPANYPNKVVNNIYDAATNWNWHNGMHHLKFGVQAVAIRADGFDTGAFSRRGSFAFTPGATSSANMNGQSPALNSFASFLTGNPTQAGISNFEQTPTNRQLLTSAYITDTLNLWKNVHLELGVRYDVFSPLRTRGTDGTATFDQNSNEFSRSDGRGRHDLRNIAPRIGIVMRPIERVAIRAGYGIQYFPVPFALAGLNQALFSAQRGQMSGFQSTQFTVPTAGTTNNLNPNQPLNYTARDSQMPYVQTTTLMVQSDLGNGILLDLGYVGNRGRHLPYSRELNAAMPGLGLAGMPGAQFGRTASFTDRGTGTNSNYNALQANLTKRFAAGLALAGAYTYGKVLDTGFQQTNPFGNNNNYGPADFDRKHILAMSHLWQLPFGPGSAYLKEGWAAQILGSWQLNGILRYASGSPYSVFADPLNCNCPGVGLVRADTTGNMTINGQSSFAGSSFSAPASGSLGMAGRNQMRGPSFFNYDTSLFRTFAFGENLAFELRAEAYNVTNSTNLVNPNGFLSSPAVGTSAGIVNGGLGRQFQFGGRFLF